MKLMSGVVVTACLIGVILFEYVAGSSWSFVPNKTLILYQHVDAPISTLPIAAKAEAGERLGVEKCFFDKNDAYFLAVKSDGKSGYTFDNHQIFSRSWQPVMVDVEFGRSLACFRLVGQFGD